MKFSAASIVLLTPLISLPIALANNDPTTYPLILPDDIDPECAQKNFPAYSLAILECAEAHNIVMPNFEAENEDDLEAYRDCTCTPKLAELYLK